MSSKKDAKIKKIFGSIQKNFPPNFKTIYSVKKSDDSDINNLKKIGATKHITNGYLNKINQGGGDNADTLSKSHSQIFSVTLYVYGLVNDPLITPQSEIVVIMNDDLKHVILVEEIKMLDDNTDIYILTGGISPVDEIEV